MTNNVSLRPPLGGGNDGGNESTNYKSSTEASIIVTLSILITISIVAGCYESTSEFFKFVISGLIIELLGSLVILLMDTKD